jgi:hypothetical protein
MSSRFGHTTPRRLLAGFAAVALAAVGMTAATASAQASTQTVHVTAAADGGTANVGALTTVNISVTNQSQSSNLASFTVVLPPGIAPAPGKTSPTALGVTGGGNWSESITGCGTVPNCSWLLVAKGLLPRSTSLVRPGATLVASVGLVPTVAGSLPFKVINIENGSFTTPDLPTITVQNVAAGAFCVQRTTPGSVTAGDTETFTVQAIQVGSFGTGPSADPCTGTPVGYNGYSNVRVHYTSDDGSTGVTRISAVAPVAVGDGTASNPVATTPSDVTFTFSPSTTGKFTFTGKFQTAALNQSFDVSEVAGTVDGNSGGFAVAAGPAASVTLLSVVDDATLGTALTPGAKFDATFSVFDAYQNITDSAIGQVALAVGGTGVFTPSGPSTASSINSVGTVSGSYDSAGTNLPITLNLASTPPSTSNIIYATFTGANTGSAIFVPGGAGTIQTSNFTAPNTDGTPTCVLSATDPACANANLPKGANGTVTIQFTTCAIAGLTGGICNSSTNPNVVLNLTASLKDAAGNSLYGPSTPATLTYVCSATNCPWDVEGDDGPVVYNSWEESVEAYADFPVHAQDSVTASNPTPPVYTVQPCQSLTGGAPSGPATSVPLAQKSCVDVKRLVRNTTTGDLSFTILYWDDYKMVP